jgi:hypothetical protein
MSDFKQIEQEQIYHWIPQKLWWLVSTYLAHRIDRSQVLDDRHGQNSHGRQPVSTGLFWPANALGTDNRREKIEKSKFIGLEKYESPKNNDQRSVESELLDHSNLYNFDEMQRTVRKQSQKGVNLLQKQRLMLEVLSKDSARSNLTKKTKKFFTPKESQRKASRVISTSKSKSRPHPQKLLSKRKPKGTKFSRNASRRFKRTNVSKKKLHSNKAKKHISQRRQIEELTNQIKTINHFANIQKAASSMTRTGKFSTKKNLKKKTRFSTLDNPATLKKMSTSVPRPNKMTSSKKAIGFDGDVIFSHNLQTSPIISIMTPKIGRGEKEHFGQLLQKFAKNLSPTDKKMQGSNKKASESRPISKI